MSVMALAYSPLHPPLSMQARVEASDLQQVRLASCQVNFTIAVATLNLVSCVCDCDFVSSPCCVK